MHSEFLSLKFTPSSYSEIGNVLLLEDRKYDPIATYGNLSTLQPMSPLTSLNLVAKAE